jgi:hypothetical protein
MGYIIKSPTGGGGGGDATAANQTTQITEAQNTNNYIAPGANSVFVDPASVTSVFKNISNGSSVFIDGTTSNSAFLDNAAESVFYNPIQRSVFKNPSTSESVFIGSLNGISVFETVSQKTVAELSETILSEITAVKNNFIRNTDSYATTVVTSFTDTTLAGVATQLQTFLQANPAISIVNISFSSGGVTQHDVLLTYNI